jgi:hypothetical protein
MGGGCKPGVTGGQVRVGKRAVGVGAQSRAHPLPLYTYCMGAYCMGLRGCWAAVGRLVPRAPVEDDGGTSTSPPTSAWPRVAGGKRPSVACPTAHCPAPPLSPP